MSPVLPSSATPAPQQPQPLSGVRVIDVGNFLAGPYAAAVMGEFGVNNLVFSSSCTVYGVPEQLPLDDQSVDASMALVTVHQWQNLDQGLRELHRVTRGPMVVLTFDGDALDRYWRRTTRWS